jgi:protein SCO1/2
MSVFLNIGQAFLLIGILSWPGIAFSQVPSPTQKVTPEPVSTPKVAPIKAIAPAQAAVPPVTEPAKTPVKSAPSTGVPADIKVVEKLGVKLPLDLSFTDDTGSKRQLNSFFDGGQPVILVPVYYRCPLLCNITLNRLVETLKDLPWTPGEGYRILAVSIDSREGPDLAKAKKSVYLKDLSMPGAETGWHFLTGQQPAIRKLMETVGFGYRYDPDKMEYLHRATLIVITPEGQIHRYFHGAYTPPVQLKLGLIKAAGGSLGTMKERVWTGIFTYDNARRKYVLNEMLLLTILGIMVSTVIILSFVAIRRRRS